MYVYNNPNPKNKNTGDCVVRAISILFDIPWEEAFIELAVMGLVLSDMPNENSVWGAYLMEKGYEREVIPNTCPDCYTIWDFALDHPEGKFAVCTGSHVVAVIDGNVYDAWNSSEQIPTYYFKEREKL